MTVTESNTEKGRWSVSGLLSCFLCTYFSDRRRRSCCCSSNCPPRVLTMLRIYTATFVSMLCDAYGTTMLFPFLPFMVQFLLPDIDESSTGRYSGIVAGAASLGKFCMNMCWGAISDSRGRKPVLLTSLVAVGAASLTFGFSVNFPMAVAVIFLQGLGNGIVSTINTILAEASTDRNRAFAMSLLSTGWGFGLILGSALSGFLADPIGQYNLTIDNDAIRMLLTRFPYSPPCIVHFLFCLSSVFIVICWLPETRKRTSGGLGSRACQVTETDPVSSVMLSNVSDREELLPEAEKDHVGKDKSEVTSKISEEKNPMGQSQESLTYTGRKKQRVLLRMKLYALQSSIICTVKTLQTFARDRVIWLTVSIFCMMSCATIMLDEVYPLWAATANHLGGLQFSVYEIGISLIVVGAFVLPFNLLLYPLMERRFGSINAFEYNAVLLICAMVLMPNVHFLVQLNRPIFLWITLCVSLLLVHIPLNACACASFLFVNNSVTFERLGTLSGLASSSGYFFRIIGPPLIGVLYSASLSNRARSIGFPFDYHLVFAIMGLLWLLMMVLVAMLPQSINKQKEPKR